MHKFNNNNCLKSNIQCIEIRVQWTVHKTTHVKIRFTIKIWYCNMHNDMWEITKFNIIYFVFVILVLKQSVITLSNIPTIYIYNSNNIKMYVIINNTCVHF